MQEHPSHFTLPSHTSHSAPLLWPQVESPSVGLEGDSPSEDTLSLRARKKKVC